MLRERRFFSQLCYILSIVDLVELSKGDPWPNSEDGVEDDLHYCTCFYCVRLGADKGARWWICGRV
jgi:hypothetical protein